MSAVKGKEAMNFDCKNRNPIGHYRGWKKFTMKMIKKLEKVPRDVGESSLAIFKR